MATCNIAVKLDDQIIARFVLETDAERFAEQLSEMTGKTVWIETETRLTRIG